MQNVQHKPKTINVVRFMDTFTKHRRKSLNVERYIFTCFISNTARITIGSVLLIFLYVLHFNEEPTYFTKSEICNTFC